MNGLSGLSPALPRWLCVYGVGVREEREEIRSHPP